MNDVKEEEMKPKSKQDKSKNNIPCGSGILASLTTECVTDLDSQSEFLIFESILTTFKLIIIYRGSLGNVENWLEP